MADHDAKRRKGVRPPAGAPQRSGGNSSEDASADALAQNKKLFSYTPAFCNLRSGYDQSHPSPAPLLRHFHHDDRNRDDGAPPHEPSREAERPDRSHRATPGPDLDPDPAPICKRATPRQATSSVAYHRVEPEEDDPLLDFAPVPHVQLRRNSITPRLQRKFIAHLAATGIVTQAARHIGKSMEAIYKLRQRPGADEFREAWDQAIERGIDRLEDCALERAMVGEERPIVSGGKLLGTYQRHDNALLRFVLTQRRRHRWATDIPKLREGSPTYERLKAEIIAQYDREGSEGDRERMEAMSQLIVRVNEAAARQEELVAQKLLTQQEIDAINAELQPPER